MFSALDPKNYSPQRWGWLRQSPLVRANEVEGWMDAAVTSARSFGIVWGSLDAPRVVMQEPN